MPTRTICRATCQGLLCLLALACSDDPATPADGELGASGGDAGRRPDAAAPGSSGSASRDAAIEPATDAAALDGSGSSEHSDLSWRPLDCAQRTWRHYEGPAGAPTCGICVEDACCEEKNDCASAMGSWVDYTGCDQALHCAASCLDERLASGSTLSHDLVLACARDCQEIYAAVFPAERSMWPDIEAALANVLQCFVDAPDVAREDDGGLWEPQDEDAGADTPAGCFTRCAPMRCEQDPASRGC